MKLLALLALLFLSRPAVATDISVPAGRSLDTVSRLLI